MKEGFDRELFNLTVCVSTSKAIKVAEKHFGFCKSHFRLMSKIIILRACQKKAISTELIYSLKIFTILVLMHTPAKLHLNRHLTTLRI